jgi:protocatechuate 3,4-dioxygenase beta subunit
MRKCAQFLFAIWLCAALGARVAGAQDTVAQAIEILWKESVIVKLPAVTNVVVLDDSIVRAEASDGKVEFFGLTRGETIAFLWAGAERVTVRIRVNAIQPTTAPHASLSSAALDSLGNGTIGSAVQVAIGPTGSINTFLTSRLDWHQSSSGRLFTVRGQIQDGTAPGMPAFNMNSVAIGYETQRTRLSVLDFPLQVNGGAEAKVSMYSAYNVYPVRGASLTMKRGSDQYETFAGTTIPSYFASLNGTRDIAGMNFTRKRSNALTMYSTVAWVNSPVSGLVTAGKRGNSAFETVGFSYRPNERWAVQGSSGASTRGLLAQGTAAYTSPRFNAFVSGTRSSASFPLNQLQLLFSGGSSISANSTVRLTERIAASVFFQHSQNGASIFSPVSAASAYYSASLNMALTSRQSITVIDTYSHNSPGALPAGTSLPTQNTRRFELTYHSMLGPRVSNTAQFTFNYLSDPEHLDRHSDYDFREGLTFPIGKTGSLTIGAERVRTDPTLVTRLSQNISALPAELQQAFLLNPTGFIQSAQLPANIQALLQGLTPSSTQISVTGQFRIGRLSISPTGGYSKDSTSLAGTSSTRLFGYALSYQLGHGLQLTSSLSNSFFFDPAKQSFNRATVLSAGFLKSISGAPKWLDPFGAQKSTIHGRVFRDVNLNGVYDPGEPGIAGIHVQISKGKSVVTDAEGRFEFAGLDPDFYEVHISSGQFEHAVRFTSPAEVKLDLFEDRGAHVDFGIVNFARLTGNVYNDYLMDGQRQPDANGLPAVRLNLTGDGVTRELITDGSGDYGLSDIVPGDYDLTLDRPTLPPNFLASDEPLHIHVAPVTSVVRDVPVRALRSISGHVYLKLKDSDAAPKPLAGIHLRIGDSTATTGPDGSFVLRNLPAGELLFYIVPYRNLPEGLTAPTGKVKMPREPIQIEDATIVISNPDLPQYLAQLDN